MFHAARLASIFLRSQCWHYAPEPLRLILSFLGGGVQRAGCHIFIRQSPGWPLIMLMLARLALESPESSCLRLVSARITDMAITTWLEILFLRVNLELWS